MTAEEVTKALGIRRATLYAYVSRGAIRSQPTSPGARTRQYGRADVQAILQKRSLRADPERVVGEALDFGTPVLDSAITLIDGGRLYYRGHDAVGLARTATVEQVAALIWSGDLAHADALFRQVPRVVPAIARPLEDLTALRPIERLAALIPLAGTTDRAAWDLRPAAVGRTGARILGAMTAIVGGTAAHGGLAARLAHAWAPNRRGAADLLGAALILCADHELNVSSFTARCVASAGGTAYNVVSAGLAALQGARHGGHTERVEALLAEIGAGEPAAVIASRLRRGEEIPGFGHRLYPAGDPRGHELIHLIKTNHLYADACRASQGVAHVVYETLGERPTIDFGLATLARVLELPPGSALALFAIGRTIGWIGQAIEQIGVDRLIRPRARYVGPAPVT